MSTTPAQGWRPLSELVRDLRKIAAMAPLELVGELAQRPAVIEAMMPPPGPQRDQRTAALVLALRHQGLLGEPQTAQQWAVHDRALSVVLSQPALVDVAELALATGQHLVVHAMRPAATRVVHETDLHTLPGECPRLLRRAFVVEADWQAGRVLWGTTACVGGFLRPDGVIVLVGLLVPDGVAVAYWRPDWGGTLGSVEGQEDPDLSKLLVGTDRKVLEAWATQAVRVLTVLSLLLEAAGTPLETRDESGQGKRPSSGKGATKGQGGRCATCRCRRPARRWPRAAVEARAHPPTRRGCRQRRSRCGAISSASHTGLAARCAAPSTSPATARGDGSRPRRRCG